MRFLERLSSALYRTPADARELDAPTARVGKVFLFLTMLAVLGWVFLPPFTSNVRAWREVSPEVPFDNSGWKTLFGAEAVECPGSVAGAGCPASVTRSALWESSTRRSDPAHLSRIRETAGQVFWLGYEVPAESVAQAIEKRAPFLVLGWIRAKHRVWVDGEFVLEGVRRDSEPMVLTLPPSLAPRLARQGKPMRIAIEITNDSGHPYVDMLNAHVSTGFFSSKNIESLRNFTMFWAKTRPIAIMVMNLVVAIFFFMAWAFARSKPEYFYLSVFALIGGAIQARSIDTFFLSLPMDHLYFVSAYLKTQLGAHGMFLGFALARSRGVIFSWGVPAAALLPLVIFPFFRSANELSDLERWIGQTILPLGFLIGATVCGLQAFNLWRLKAEGRWVPHRFLQLALFAAGLLGLTALYAITADRVGARSTDHYQVFSRNFVHLGLVLYLGLVIFHEYRKQSVSAIRTPVSEYHKKPVLPESAAGVVMAFELKASEVLAVPKEEVGESGNLVFIWTSHVYHVVARNRGVVVRKKGDGLVALFPNDRGGSPWRRAAVAYAEIVHLSRSLATQFGEIGCLRGRPDDFCFRASVTEGSLRPIWESFGSIREPAWEDVGSASALVESGRLLELEAQFVGQETRTSLIMPRRFVRGGQNAPAAEALAILGRGSEAEADDAFGFHHSILIFGEPAVTPTSEPKSGPALVAA